MEDTQSHKDFENLIAKYLRSDISPGEAELLLKWIQSSSDHRALFDEMIQINNSLAENSHAVSHKKAYDEFLRHANPKVSGKSRQLWIRVASVAAVFIGIILWFFIDTEHNSIPIMVTNVQEVKQHILPDSTSVHLNSFAEIEYEKEFESNRELKLKGNAFFDVKPDKKHPFKINIGEIVVEVLGTSFNVDQDYENSKVTISVVSGLVKVSCSANGYEILLRPSERCEISCNEGFKTDSISQTDNYLSWVTNELQFENATLSKVVQDLNRHYNCNIQIASEELANESFSSKFKNESLDDVLELIRLTLKVKVISTDDIILITDPE